MLVPLTDDAAKSLRQQTTGSTVAVQVYIKVDWQAGVK